MSKYNLELPFSPGDEVYVLRYVEADYQKCKPCHGSGSIERSDCHGYYDVGCSTCKGKGSLETKVDAHWACTERTKMIKRIIVYSSSIRVDVDGFAWMSKDLIMLEDCFITKLAADKEAIKRNKMFKEAQSTVKSRGRV